MHPSRRRHVQAGRARPRRSRPEVARCSCHGVVPQRVELAGEFSAADVNSQSLLVGAERPRARRPARREASREREVLGRCQMLEQATEGQRGGTDRGRSPRRRGRPPSTGTSCGVGRAPRPDAQPRSRRTGAPRVSSSVMAPTVGDATGQGQSQDVATNPATRRTPRWVLRPHLRRPPGSGSGPRAGRGLPGARPPRGPQRSPLTSRSGWCRPPAPWSSSTGRWGRSATWYWGLAAFQVSGSSSGRPLAKSGAARSPSATRSYGPASPTSPSTGTYGLEQPAWYWSPTSAARAASWAPAEWPTTTTGPTSRPDSATRAADSLIAHTTSSIGRGKVAPSPWVR